MLTSPRYPHLLATTLLVALAAATLLVSAAAARPSSGATSKAARLQQDLDAIVAAGAPGAVLLVRNGQTTSRFTAGLADLATRAPIQARDHYRIASLTKSYVATLVLQLVGEGKVRLNDTVDRWLPGLVPQGNKISIRMLLIHTSGIYDHEKDPEVLAPYLNGNLGYYWSPLRLVKLAVSRPPLFAPGTSKRSSYSSTNYLVAALIVERATGNSLGTELKRRIFQPLHLRATTYPTRKTQLPAPYAHGYFLLGQPPLTDLSGLSPSLSGPAGAIVSTVGDIAGFYRGLLGGKLLRPSLLAAMKSTIPETKGDLHQRMGLGLERFPSSCGPAWGHSGSFPGYWTHAWSSANGRRQAVLMLNIDPSAATPPATAAFYKALEDGYCSTS
jgi:D-alanyl-D-alanine carboxypeptidase